MAKYAIYVLAAAFLAASPAVAQTGNDPFPSPITANGGPLRVGIEDFAALPDFDSEPARMMHLADEPGTNRMFVNDMWGVLYAVSYDGQTVTRYLDLTAASWKLDIQSSNFERGFQSFAFHPQFSQPGTPGFGKFYTYIDTSNRTPEPDFRPGGGQNTHDTLLFEWTSTDPAAATYDGGAPRELFRVEQPFPNHNGGQIGFNPAVSPQDPDFGLLYVGSADGGAGGDPLDMSQNLGLVFGKILRIDPLGTNGRNGKYGIPEDNPFASDGESETLDEIYAYGVRNPQRFAWDSCAPGFPWTLDCERVLAGGVSKWGSQIKVRRRRREPGGRPEMLPGTAVGDGCRPGASARRCCVCCAARILSPCRGSWGSRRRGPRSGGISFWPQARPA